MDTAPKDTTKNIAANLLEIGAIRLNTQKPFVWSSGWKSPIYCDNRISLSFPKIRKYIKQALAGSIKTNFPEAEAIAGVATAGIPHGVLVADALNLPFLYVRSKAKGHGLANAIEGKIIAEQKVVLIEDLISTGGSAIAAAKTLKTANMNVLGVSAVFSYDFEEANNNFRKEGIKVNYLSSYPVLIKLALEKNIVTQGEMESLEKWRKSPASWPD